MPTLSVPLDDSGVILIFPCALAYTCCIIYISVSFPAKYYSLEGSSDDQVESIIL